MDEIEPNKTPKNNQNEKDYSLGMAVAGLVLVIFFIWFLFNVPLEEPERVYIPGHWEIIQPKMTE